LTKEEKDSLFTEEIIPHLDAAYSLARWLARNEHDAEDIVQDSFARAYSYFNSFSGKDGKKWLLAIVRNTFYSWYKKKLVRQGVEVAEEQSFEEITSEQTSDMELETKNKQEVVHHALNSLPLEFREVIILRELESMSYKEIAALIGVPIGTVMSRLARGRDMLRTLLVDQLDDEA
jgi:RNA polymerase sigma-70 factor (ECF subfamily)